MSLKDIKHRIDFTTIALFVALGLFMVSLYSATLTNRGVGKENQTYSRFTACALSFPATSRTQEQIDYCWEVVQRDTGVTVKRYDREIVEKKL